MPGHGGPSGGCDKMQQFATLQKEVTAAKSSPPLVCGCFMPRPLPAVRRRCDFFEKQIRPVLSEQCWSCHGPKKQNAGLRPRFAGRRYSRAASPAGDRRKEPAKSLLLAAIRHEGELRMPPKPKAKLRSRPSTRWPSGSNAVLRGRKQTAAEAPDWRKHWAFQPVANPTPPSMRTTWSRHADRRFRPGKLQEKGLSPVAATPTSGR